MAGRRDFHESKRTPTYPLKLTPNIPRKHPQMIQEFRNINCWARGGVWGMFQRYVGKLLEWSFNHTNWLARLFFCSVWLSGNYYCTFANQSLSNDFAFIFWGVYQNHMLISYLLMPVPMSHFVDDSQPLNENSFNQGITFWRGVWNPKQPVSNCCLCKVSLFLLSTMVNQHWTTIWDVFFCFFQPP